MPSPTVIISLSWALGLFFRLMSEKRKNERRRRRLRRLGRLMHHLEIDHPASYCQLNNNVPVLRLWFSGEAELKQDFRLSRKTMQGLQRLLQKDQNHGWGNQLEVPIYTYWLAHGLSYRVVSAMFSVPKTTVHSIVHRVAQQIWRNLQRAIFFPKPEDLQAVGQGFGQLTGSSVFNNVVGAIDDCHVQIKPPNQQKIDYLNCKGFFYINMLAICDSSGKFLDIFVGYPGSVHDTQILKNSSSFRGHQYSPAGYILLGDGGYPCLDQPITPYREPVNGQIQARFNYHHSKGRSIIERAFGMMKTRWRSTLFKALEVRATFAPLLIASCAFLHNVCIDNGDMLESNADVLQDILIPQPPREQLADKERPGNGTRDRLAALVSGHVHAP